MFRVIDRKPLDRRSFLRLAGRGSASAVALAAMPGLVQRALAAAPEIPLVEVDFAMVSYTNHTWPIIGIRNGWFEEAGFTITPPDGRIIFENQTVPLIQNGEADIATIFVGVLTPVLDKIEDVRPFLVHSYWQGNTILVSPDSAFKTIDDFMTEGLGFSEAAKRTMEQLRGQRLTVPPTISTRPWLEFVYGFGDMMLEDSELLALEDPNAVQLAVSGQVDFAAPAGAVQIYQLQFQAGWRPLMSTRQMVKYAGGPDGAPVNRILNFDGFAASTDYIAANRENIHRFNSVLYRTMAAIFGPNQAAELEKQVPFVNAATGAQLDAAAIKFIFEELDPFFPWELQARVWGDKSYPLEYHNVYDYQIQKFIDDGTISGRDYDLDAFFPAKGIYEEAADMKAEAEALISELSAASLSDEQKVIFEAGKAWFDKYNFLDATRFLKAAAG
jgi:ABC-type nitrate/sulfonate/bicarbonate transport system substrate-binding protein